MVAIMLSTKTQALRKSVRGKRTNRDVICYDVLLLDRLLFSPSRPSSRGLTKTGEGLMGVLSYSLSPGSSQDLSGLDISLFSLP